MAIVDLGKVVGDSASVTVGTTTTLEAGQNATVQNVGTTANAVFNFGIPRGANGTDGVNGRDGVDGTDGVDGYSPIANVTKSGDVTTISITDKNGTTTESVDVSNKQDTLVSGTNIKTINNTSLLGSGDITVGGLTEEQVMAKIRDAGVVELDKDMLDDIVAKYNYNKLTPAMLYLEYGDAIYRFSTGYKLYASTSTSNFKDIVADSYAIMIDSGQIFMIFIAGDVLLYQCLGTITVTSAYPFNTYLAYYSNLSNGIKNIMGDKYLTTDTAQTISAKKTFTTLPETSVTPTTNDQLTNKAYVDPTVTSSSTTTYTITSLGGNQVYKLGEITALLINAVTLFDRESTIYFTSGTTATSVGLPDTVVNIGDFPTFTASGGTNVGTCEANKSYIIAVLNGIAVWKAY